MSSTCPHRRSGSVLRLHGICLLAGLFISISLPANAASADWTLPRLMSALAATQGDPRFSELNYRETKYLAALDTPLMTEGVLRSLPDDTLEMEVRSPQWAKYIITPQRFTILRRDKPAREIELQDEPRLAGFVAAFRAMRKGDLALLRQYYATELNGSENAWQLRLRPLDEDLAGHISYLYLQGNEGVIEEIVTIQSDGDRSTMQLSPAGE